MTEVPSLVDYVLGNEKRFGVWFARDYKAAKAIFAELLTLPQVPCREKYHYPLALIIGFKNGSRIKCASPMSLAYLGGTQVNYLTIAGDDDGVSWVRPDILRTLAGYMRGTGALITSSSSLSAAPIELNIPALLREWTTTHGEDLQAAS